MHKAFPLLVKTSHCQKKFPLLKISDATAEKIALLSEDRAITFSKVVDPVPEQWQFRIQQYLQHEHYALWEVIEFGDSYEAPKDGVITASGSDGTSKKKGRTVTLTTDDIKHKTAQKLWAAILKTFGGNEATKKTKKNLLKHKYGNFKAEGSKNLEQTFNRLQSCSRIPYAHDSMEKQE
nr:hypothetical protein [Tanacetum cinerariifolium]